MATNQQDQQPNTDLAADKNKANGTAHGSQQGSEEDEGLGAKHTTRPARHADLAAANEHQPASANQTTKTGTEVSEEAEEDEVEEKSPEIHHDKAGATQHKK